MAVVSGESLHQHSGWFSPKRSGHLGQWSQNDIEDGKPEIHPKPCDEQGKEEINKKSGYANQ